MIPIYEESADHLQIVKQNSIHIPPHLHQSIEIILVTDGTLVAGTGTDLFEMHPGDLGVIFPNLIHHYQVFVPGTNRHVTLLASPAYFGIYADFFRNYEPKNPVISKEQVPPNVIYALKNLMEINQEHLYSSPDFLNPTHGNKNVPELPPQDLSGLSEAPDMAAFPGVSAAPPAAQNGKASSQQRSSRLDASNDRAAIRSAAVTSGPNHATLTHDSIKGDVKPEKDARSSPLSEQLTAACLNTLNHSFTQIILASCLPLLKLQKRTDLKDHDIVYQTAVYISAHYREDISLTTMSQALGISQFALSRVFSGVFHQNFNHYLNDVRLQHASALLADSDRSVTDIYLDCGFQSQATFNRAFQAKYHMAPRDYRRQASLAAQ